MYLNDEEAKIKVLSTYFPPQGAEAVILARGDLRIGLQRALNESFAPVNSAMWDETNSQVAVCFVRKEGEHQSDFSVALKLFCLQYQVKHMTRLLKAVADREMHVDNTRAAMYGAHDEAHCMQLDDKTFSVSSAKSGRKVVTRRGQDVRIVDYDRKCPNNSYTLLALVRVSPTEEKAVTYNTLGKRGANLPLDLLDLFLK